MKGTPKDVIKRVIQAKGWFWADYHSGLSRKLRQLERDGFAVLKFKNKHGVYWERGEAKQ